MPGQISCVIQANAQAAKVFQQNKAPGDAVFSDVATEFVAL